MVEPNIVERFRWKARSWKSAREDIQPLFSLTHFYSVETRLHTRYIPTFSSHFGEKPPGSTAHIEESSRPLKFRIFRLKLSGADDAPHHVPQSRRPIRRESIDERIVILRIEFCQFRLVQHGIQNRKGAFCTLNHRELTWIAVVEISGFQQGSEILPAT